MYLISGNHMVSVNTTSITSIEVEPVEFPDEEMQEQYPEAYAVNAYGKENKVYKLGVYKNKEIAVWKLNCLHYAMNCSEKTFQF